VESDAAEHVIGNIRELTWFFSNVYFLSQFVRAAALYLSKELTLLVTLVYSSLIGVTLSVFLVFNRSSVYHIAQNNSRCIIVVQNVTSVFFLYFWMEYLFILDQKASVDFSVVFILFIYLFIC